MSLEPPELSGMSQQPSPLEALLAGQGSFPAMLDIPPDADDETMVELAIALSLQEQVCAHQATTHFPCLEKFKFQFKFYGLRSPSSLPADYPRTVNIKYFWYILSVSTIPLKKSKVGKTGIYFLSPPLPLPPHNWKSSAPTPSIILFIYT